MTHILILIAKILVGIPAGLLIGFFGLLIVVYVLAFLFRAWWVILYIITFSWKTKLIPQPPTLSEEYFKKDKWR